MTRRPSFQFYPDDFMSGTTTLSRAAVGCYTAMLCTSWSVGAIQNSRHAIFKAMGLGPDDPPFDEIWRELQPKWKLTEKGWINARLEQVRADRDAYVQEQRRKGQLGGRPPKPSGGQKNTKPGLLESKATASKEKAAAKKSETSPSPISDLRSTTKGQEQRADARDSYPVLLKIAHEVLDKAEGSQVEQTLNDLTFDIKSTASRAGIDYGSNGELVRRALDSAVAQRQRRRTA